MGKIISLLFTLGIGFIIGLNLPKDTLQKIHLPEQLSKINVFQKTEKQEEEPVKTETPSYQKKSSPKTTKKEFANTTATVKQINEPPTIKSNLFTVQIASFTNKREAQGYVNRMNDQQIDAYIAPSDLSQNKNLFRIFVGEYTSRADALAKQQNLAKRFKDSFVQGF